MPPDPSYRPAPRTPALGEGFFDVVAPAHFPRQQLRFRNDPWAQRMGLASLTDGEWLQHFASFLPLPQNLDRPLALRYHGHQFQTYNAQLGDGRGFLFAQLQDPVDGRLLDLGTKGSGQTPWSRRGDGRLTLKGGVREVLATEMLEALGVYTSKSFSLVETGEQLQRSDEPSPTRSSVLVRLSHGHVRFGTFQRLAHHRDVPGLQRLLAFCIENYFPQLVASPEPAEALFRQVCLQTAALCASYLAAGFVHGVLNTDNMNITGESFDYGPYRFLPRYEPDFVAAYFDDTGLYAFGRQREAMHWNLERLKEALGRLCREERLAVLLADFLPLSFRLFHQRFIERLGLVPKDPVNDSLLCGACLCFLEESRLGYDRFFFDWQGGLPSEQRALSGPAGGSYRGERFATLRERLAAYVPAAPQRLGDPYFQGSAPCSLLIEEIEDIWRAIDERDDWSPFATKIAQIRAMGQACGNTPACTPPARPC